MLKCILYEILVSQWPVHGFPAPLRQENIPVQAEQSSGDAEDFSVFGQFALIYKKAKYAQSIPYTQLF